VKANPDKLEKALAVTFPIRSASRSKDKPEFRDACLRADRSFRRPGIHMDLLKKWELDVNNFKEPHPLRQVMSLFVHYLSLPYLIEGICSPWR